MRARTTASLVAALMLAAVLPVTAQVPTGPTRVQLDTVGDPSLGPAGAAVTIVEFCDFQCPYCAQLSGSLRQLTREFPNDVRVVFKDFPLDSHEDADRAAEAASCAGEQDKYWQMHDVLFASQDLSDPALRTYAGRVGANVDRFMTCLNSGRYEAEWRRDREQGHTYGVNATPTFFVNGLLNEGVPTYDELVGLVRGELGTR
jgi:protein-disulfide isomerase